jgi:mRNA-degrading endonuclease RelE of RelBE toxin-antitoxin system
MRIQTTKPFDEDYDALPEGIKERAEKQFVLLMENPHHPSLRLKKIKGHPNIWEGRVTKSYRFTFQISGEIYLLRRIGTHDVLKTPW